MPPRRAHGKAVGQSSKRTSSTSDPSHLPNWPPLNPLVPKEDLSMEVLWEGQIVVIRNLFTSTLCKNFVSFLSSLPLITTPATPKQGEAVRVNDRYEIHDPGFAEQLWSSTALKYLLTESHRNIDENEEEKEAGEFRTDHEQLWGGACCGLNPRIRVYRYRKGQFFGPHYDESQLLAFPTSPTTAVQTTWTLLIYLTSCVGGETVFYPDPGPGKKLKSAQEPLVVGLEAGMALLHKHGRDCMLHEGRAVVEGEKWVLRSDVCVRR